MNEHLAGLYAYTMPYHVGFAVILAALCLLYLALTQFGVSGKNYVLKIRYFLPLYHGVIACVTMTGFVLLAAFDFALNFASARMLVAIIALVALSAIGFKRLKIYARAGELAKFKKFALFKSAADILLVILAAA